MDSPTAEITAGKLRGKLLTNFTGSISDFVKSYGCLDATIKNFTGKDRDMLAVNAPHAVTATAYDRTTQRFERIHSHPLNAKTARIFSYFMRFYQRCFSCFFLP